VSDVGGIGRCPPPWEQTQWQHKRQLWGACLSRVVTFCAALGTQAQCPEPPDKTKPRNNMSNSGGVPPEIAALAPLIGPTNMELIRMQIEAAASDDFGVPVMYAPGGLPTLGQQRTNSVSQANYDRLFGHTSATKTLSAKMPMTPKAKVNGWFNEPSDVGESIVCGCLSASRAFANQAVYRCVAHLICVKPGTLVQHTSHVPQPVSHKQQI
jgi:hypothetical protein